MFIRRAVVARCSEVTVVAELTFEVREQQKRSNRELSERWEADRSGLSNRTASAYITMSLLFAGATHGGHGGGGGEGGRRQRGEVGEGG